LEERFEKKKRKRMEVTTSGKGDRPQEIRNITKSHRIIGIPYQQGLDHPPWGMFVYQQHSHRAFRPTCMDGQI
jgi:hypothetical protein